MKNSKINDLMSGFVDGENCETKKNKDTEDKMKIISERNGLIERVDKIIVTEDGRQLLREQY